MSSELPFTDGEGGRVELPEGSSLEAGFFAMIVYFVMVETRSENFDGLLQSITVIS